MPLPPSSYANLFQIAYVTRDLDAALNTLAEVHGVSDFFVAGATLNLTYPPGRTTLKFALAWVGDHEFEVIQPIEDATNIFAPAAAAAPGNLAFHHVCMKIPGTQEDWDAFRASVAQERIVIEGGRDGMRFIYTDERATIGHYLEYIWTNAEFLRANPHRIPPAQRPEAIV